MKETIIGKKVLHKKYGEGAIESCSGEKITVRFATEPNPKLFKFPDAFENYIHFVNKSIQEEILAVVEDNKQKIQERKKRANINRRNTSMAKEEDIKKQIINPSLANYHYLEDAILSAWNDLMEIGKRNIDFPFPYNERWNQACYSARYLYAYTFEYEQMFKKMLSMGLDINNLNVLSLGCGTMIDGWALNDVLIENNISSRVNYIGVDITPWEQNYEPHITGPVLCRFVEKRAQDYLVSLNALDFDIIVFPKSLGDIGIDQTILSAMKKITKQSFYLAVSMIEYEDGVSKDDKKLLNKLVETIEDCGYKVEADECSNHNDEKSSIWKDWGGRPHPLIKEEVKVQTGKEPILRRKFENYRIIRFTKVKK